MADIMKLIVCLSKDLPKATDRSSEKMYMTYDKLGLYIGCNTVDENFAICSTMPDDPVPGMIYIYNTDGTVHRQVDYSDTIIAELEDSTQLELLKKAGTVFYVNNDNSYLDSQKRSLTLPFNDGTYELNVSSRNNQVFDKNTIVKYSEKDNRFNVYGPDDEEFVDYSKAVKGGKTNTVELRVDGGRLYGFLKISSALDNVLRVASDGLYAKITDKVDRATFEQWKSEVDDFKKYAQDILDNIDAEFIGLEKLISPETIKAKILENLSEKYPTIDKALQIYGDISKDLDRIENEVVTYASDTITTAASKLQEELDENSAWIDLDDTSSTYTHEINYYETANKYRNPDISSEQLKLILSSAVMSYLLGIEED